MKSRKTNIGLIMLMVLSIIFAACGSSGSSNNNTVTYMTWESTTTNAAIDTALKKFTDKSISISRLESPSSDYDQKISSMIQAHSLPDFFWY